MSVQAISCAFALRGISSSEKLVLLALANYADEHMRCWPSQETLAKETELSERTVWGALKALEEKRILSRQQRKRADGTRSTDVFTLHFCLTITSEPVANPAKSTRKSREDNSQNLQDPVATVATLTTFEPSEDDPSVTLSHPSRSRVDEAKQRMSEVKAAAGDALACMATTLGVATIQALSALMKETPACDWHLDVLPAVTSAAAWHRAQDGPGSMKSWTLAVKIARENRNRRLNPPPVELNRVRPSAPSGRTPRDAAFLERMQGVHAAMEAAVEQAPGRRGSG
jgi:biotin operon repressor